MCLLDAGSSARLRRLLRVLFFYHLLLLSFATEEMTESRSTSDGAQDAVHVKSSPENPIPSSSEISNSTGVSTEPSLKVPIGFDNFSMTLPEDPDLRLAVCLLRQIHRANILPVDLPGSIGPFLTKEVLKLLHLENISLPESCISSLCRADVEISGAVTDGHPSLTYFAMYSGKRGILDSCSKALEVYDESIRSLDAEGNAVLSINCCYRLVLFSSPSCLYIPKEKILPLMTMYVFAKSPPKCLTSILCSPSTYIEIIIRENKTTVWVPEFHGYPPVSELHLCYDIALKINDKEREEGKRNKSDVKDTVAYFPMLPLHEMVVMKQPLCHRMSLFLMKLMVYGKTPLPESCLDLFCQSARMSLADQNTYLSFQLINSDGIDRCLSQLMASPAVIRQDSLNTLSLSLESNYAVLPAGSKYFFLAPQRSLCLVNFQINFEALSLAVQRNTKVSEECSTLLCEQILIPVITERFRYLHGNMSANVISSCYSTLPSTPGLANEGKLLRLTPKHGVLLVSPVCPYYSISKGSLFALMNENGTFPSQCFAELCNQDILFIEIKNKGLSFYLGHSDTYTNRECFVSIQNSTLSYQREVDLQNCTMLTVELPGTTDLRSKRWQNFLVIRNPSCGYNRQFGYATSGRFMNFLSTKVYASAPEDIRKPYQCLASKLEGGYDLEMLVGAVDSAEKFRAYTNAVKLILPPSCQNLMCEQSIMVLYHSQNIFGRDLETYISVLAQDVQSSKTMAKCITDLKVVQSNDTESLKIDGPLEVGITSSVSMSGGPSLGTYSLVFVTFPDCMVINGLLRASQISFAYIFLKDFPDSCRTVICDPNSLFHHEAIAGENFIYSASKNATAYSMDCQSQLKEKEEFFGVYTVDESIMRDTTGVFRHFVFDFDPPQKYSSLYSYLLLQKRHLNIDDSCLRCLSECNVETFFDRLIYMMVPHNDSIYECHHCFSTGNPITGNENFYTDQPDVVVLLNSTVSVLLHRSGNRAKMVAHETLLHRISGYLYFYSHNLFRCMNVTQPLHSFGQDTSGGYEYNLVFTNQVWSTCLDEIQANADFVCTPKLNYTLCSEDTISSISANTKLLFLLPCRNFSVDTLRLMSHSSVMSHLGWEDSHVYDRVCHTNTLVAEFTTYSRVLYYETVNSAADVKQALGDLQEHWEILPSSHCTQLIFDNFADCSKIYNLEKLYEVINSRTGVNRVELRQLSVLYQCLTYNHAQGSIKLLRVIASEGSSVTCELLYTYPNTTYAIKESDDVRMITISRKREEGSTVVSRTIDDFETTTDQCPTVSAPPSEGVKEVLSMLAAAVAQNNSECVENACTGHFKLLTDIHNDLAVLGPLSLSVYGTSCYTAVPSSTWRAVDLALGASRVTLNKFWPGCYFDHIIMWKSAEAKANEWDYLSTICRLREVVFFIINMLLTLLTIVVNLIVIVTVFKSRSLAFNPRYRLQVNLAISDLLMGIFVGSQALHDHLGLLTGSLTLKDFDSLSVFANFKDVTEQFTFGLQQLRFPRGGYPAFCGFVFSLCSFVSLTVMSLLTLELLLGSSYTLIHQKLFTPGRMTLLFLLLWFGGIGFSVLLLQKEEGHVMVAYFDPISKLTTSLPSSSVSSASFIAFYSALTLFALTSLFVVVVSAISVTRVFGAQKRLQEADIDFRGQKLDEHNRAFRNLVAIFVGAYLLSVVPLATGSTGNLFMTSPLGHYIVWWTYMASSAWNPFLYNLRLRKFKVEIRRNFRVMKEVVMYHWRAIMPESCIVPLPRRQNRTEVTKKTFKFFKGVSNNELETGDSNDKLEACDSSGQRANSECSNVPVEFSSGQAEAKAMEMTTTPRDRNTIQNDPSASSATSASC